MKKKKTTFASPNHNFEKYYCNSFLDEFEKKVFTNLPNYGTGSITLSEKKINECFFGSSFFTDWYSTDSEKADTYFKYQYKTRYSREAESHIKIDEYTLQRKIVEQTRRGKEREKKRKEKYEKSNKIKDYKNKNISSKNSRYNKIYTKYMPQSIPIEQNDSSDSLYSDTPYNRNKEDAFYKCVFTEPPEKRKLQTENKIYTCKEKPMQNKFMRSNFSTANPDPTSPHHFFPPYTLSFIEQGDKEFRTESVRVLSAPKLKDDFYYSVLDCSSKNIIAVGLECSLNLWNNNTGRSEELFLLSPMRHKTDVNKKMKKRYVTSVKWHRHGNFLAVGLSTGAVDIWDVERKVKVRKYKNHKLRVGTLCWNADLLTSGSRDTVIVNYDLRIKENNITELKKHTLEVCGIQWNPNEQQLASGGNDRALYIWDRRTNKVLFHFDKHKATVKAMGWSPHESNMLISGGGGADKNIFFWNTAKGTCLNKIHTDSQVCALLWSKNSKEFVSSHSSLYNQIVIWRYPKPKKLAVLSEHEKRALHLALTPDGSTIISASPDETMRFWDVFPQKKEFPFFDN